MNPDKIHKFLLYLDYACLRAEARHISGPTRRVSREDIAFRDGLFYQFDEFRREVNKLFANIADKELDLPDKYTKLGAQAAIHDMREAWARISTGLVPAWDQHNEDVAPMAVEALRGE